MPTQKCNFIISVNEPNPAATANTELIVGSTPPAFSRSNMIKKITKLKKAPIIIFCMARGTGIGV